MNFIALISHKNLGTSIHAATCRCVVNKTRREGAVPVEGESAEAVARQWDIDNDVAARKLSATKVCNCTGA